MQVVAVRQTHHHQHHQHYHNNIHHDHNHSNNRYTARLTMALRTFAIWLTAELVCVLYSFMLVAPLTLRTPAKNALEPIALDVRIFAHLHC